MPGEVIQTLLKERGWTQEELARVIGRYRPEISNLISGKRGVTPDLAVALGAAFDKEPEFWLQLEADRQLTFTRQDPEEVRQRAKIYTLAPIREMELRGWIPSNLNDSDLEVALCKFFGVDRLEDAGSMPVAARQSHGAIALNPVQQAWVSRARGLASSLIVKEFQSDKIDEIKTKLRKLAAYRKEARHVAPMLAEYGIRFVVVEPLRKSSIDGAAFWLDEQSPCIAVSLRFDRVDTFWFTLMHEFAHIQAGDAQSVDDNLTGENSMPTEAKDEVERRADCWAQESLVPSGELRSFIRRVGPLYSKEKITQFAHRVKIHPGIIVGQLHYCGEIGYRSHRATLVKIRDVVTETSLTDGFGHIAPSSI